MTQLKSIIPICGSVTKIEELVKELNTKIKLFRPGINTNVLAQNLPAYFNDNTLRSLPVPINEHLCLIVINPTEVVKIVVIPNSLDDKIVVYLYLYDTVYDEPY